MNQRLHLQIFSRSKSPADLGGTVVHGTRRGQNDSVENFALGSSSNPQRRRRKHSRQAVSLTDAAAYERCPPRDFLASRSDPFSFTTQHTPLTTSKSEIPNPKLDSCYVAKRYFAE